MRPQDHGQIQIHASRGYPLTPQPPLAGGLPVSQHHSAFNRPRLCQAECLKIGRTGFIQTNKPLSHQTALRQTCSELVNAQQIGTGQQTIPLRRQCLNAIACISQEHNPLPDSGS